MWCSPRSCRGGSLGTSRVTRRRWPAWPPWSTRSDWKIGAVLTHFRNCWEAERPLYEARDLRCAAIRAQLLAAAQTRTALQQPAGAHHHHAGAPGAAVQKAILAGDCIRSSKHAVDEYLRDGGLNQRPIHEAGLIGGSTCIPTSRPGVQKSCMYMHPCWPINLVEDYASNSLEPPEQSLCDGALDELCIHAVGTRRWPTRTCESQSMNQAYVVGIPVIYLP